MPAEFVKNTQKFSIKKSVHAIKPDEAIVKFKDSREMHAFLKNAMKNRLNSDSIQRIANDISPSYIRTSLKSPPPLSTNQERLDYLFSEIAKGNANVVLKNDSLRLEPKKSRPPEDEENGLFERIDFGKIAERQVDHLKKAYSKIVHADYTILEKVYHYDENSTGVVPYVVDTSSVQEHSTGWTSWEDPFDIAVLGAFKAVVAFKATAFLNLNNRIIAAAIGGSKLELISAEYLVTGKTIALKRWYGSYAIRFNLRTLSLEVPWVKFKKCGPEERWLVELKRRDRLRFHKRPIYNHPEVMIPPFFSMEKFLSDHKKGFSLPEHDVNKPIKISIFNWL